MLAPKPAMRHPNAKLGLGLGNTSGLLKGTPLIGALSRVGRTATVKVAASSPKVDPAAKEQDLKTRGYRRTVGTLTIGYCQGAL